MNSRSPDKSQRTMSKNAGGSKPLRRGQGREEDQERKAVFSSMAMVQSPPPMTNLPRPSRFMDAEVDSRESKHKYMHLTSVQPPSNLSMPKPIFGRHVKTSPVEVKKNITLKKAGERWNVKIAPDLPWFPLEKKYKIHEPSNVVAERIDTCLQERSVFAEFDTENAVATCMTGCYTKYVISLFNEDDGKATTVEVQMRKGCSLAFRKERSAILNAARAVDTPCSKEKALVIPESVTSQFEPKPDHELKSVLIEIANQLRTGKKDEQLMTLRNLACMTNIEKSNPDSCKKMAKILVKREVGICEILTSILVGRIIDSVHAMIRNAAYNTMINVLNVLAMEGCLEQVVRDESWFAQTLFPSLFDDINNCDCIHNACLSSKCASILLQNSPIILEHARDEQHNLIRILEEAVARGDTLHLKLRDEAQKTINALQCQ